MSAVPPLVPPPLPVPPRRKERWWLHVLLFLLTLGTTTFMGAGFAINYRPSLWPEGPTGAMALRNLLDGALTFSLPLLAILLAHELGHYLTCRKYGIDASPPYFLPFLSLAGTLGAFIRIREPIRDKRRLFDVGVAGPIAGFVVALPVLAWGILGTRLDSAGPLTEGTLIFDYPLLVMGLQRLLLGETFTSLDVVEHPAFVAGWVGLFVTALNLVPLGQLDGGHALYAVFGRIQRYLAVPIFGAVLLLGFRFPGWWGLGVLLLFLGIFHPPVVDEDVPLDARRKGLALLVLVIFVVCFVPVPVREVGRVSAPRRPPREGRGTVVHQLDLHHGAELPG